jgi:PKHD-type hydroxylase
MSNYKNIINYTEQRAKLFPSWCWKKNVFSDEELEKIDEILSRVPPEPPKVSTGIDENGIEKFEEDSKFRRSEISFSKPNEKNFWFFQKMNDAITEINNNFYNFDLNGYDYIQYTKYYANNNGHYSYHIDTAFDVLIPEPEQRKLSIILMLSDPNKDFEGGEFEMFFGGDTSKKIAFEKGMIVFFPSFLLHKVNPVTKGIRKTIVLWVVGPKFK